ncbi:MAG: hydroxymethylglutaryl-CoA reductase, degradative [Planctomycetes bacterium]|nr:hydroxymethylglutaryl-CoA reductase, degradative [Planctomycetota bacterium]HPY75439.1 hydroxymethylglutaryl-CoA reductase, degradative [Planctomycetota bacterium]HQB00853.1 hydroxymethylglutaryl-CoA reductase, degradative [Planctomycetota bacterium]
MEFPASHFYKLSPNERLDKVVRFCNLDESEKETLQGSQGLNLDQANHMIENVIGTIELPVGLGVHFLINEKEYIVPMAIEEPSVVAAASKMAKIAAIHGGFYTTSTDPVMIAQIQLTNLQDPYGARIRLLLAKEKILRLANEQDPILTKLGGGAIDWEVKVIDTEGDKMVICHILVNCKDAMGANAVNTMAEALAPIVAEIAQATSRLRILSNLAVHRLARAYAVFDKEALDGEEVVDGIIAAYQFAKADPYRAATHNKGIMNGIIAVALATGQDTRALEAGAHSYAARGGQYTSLTTWEKNREGHLVGTIELPMAVGIVGGATKSHPTVRTNLKILNIKSANELGEVIAAVGLAQNVGALRALANEGIQKGHMSLHARNLAIMAGAPLALVDTVVERLKSSGVIRLDKAQKIVQELLSSDNSQ